MLLNTQKKNPSYLALFMNSMWEQQKIMPMRNCLRILDFKQNF